VVGKGKGRVIGDDVQILLGVGVTGVGVLSALLWTAWEPEACCERSTYPTSRKGRCRCRSGIIAGSVDFRSSGFDLLEMPLSWSNVSNDARKGFAASLWLASMAKTSSDCSFCRFVRLRGLAASES
jgi:hypothetical protein